MLFLKVGDPDLDHKCWQRPESMTLQRPLTQVNTSFPGTEVAAETAAALASASLVFKKINSTYSSALLMHAQQLFAFADTYRGSYSITDPSEQRFYNSSGYGDELLWAASWLYLASADRSYLSYVTIDHGQEFGNWRRPSWISWNDKLPGVQVHVMILFFLLPHGKWLNRVCSLYLFVKLEFHNLRGMNLSRMENRT